MPVGSRVSLHEPFVMLIVRGNDMNLMILDSGTEEERFQERLELQRPVFGKNQALAIILD